MGDQNSASPYLAGDLNEVSQWPYVGDKNIVATALRG